MGKREKENLVDPGDSNSGSGSPVREAVKRNKGVFIAVGIVIVIIIIICIL